ncbi:MAG: NAD(+) kinase [Gammaproteobacteria bacterium]|nr:MAG: NAD(+) kinase [Gammaproteobacteria bacterium]
MSNAFRTIGLISKTGDPGVTDTLVTLAADLGKRGLKVILDVSAAEHFVQPTEAVMKRTELAGECDLAIVLGGDGTLLNAARSLAEANVPVLGVNLGRLGFLADVSPGEMHERLDEILAGRYEEERRSLIHASVIRSGQTVSESDALNDAVIHKWDISRMIELDTSIDRRFLNSLRADGLIIATPTGSTAYALSGGGPILDPALEALVLVPICPHTLSNRPIVVSDQVEIEVVLQGDATTKAQITCDGQVNFELVAGDRVHIRRNNHDLRLIHPQQHDHFDIMRKKLRWAEQP